MNRRRPILSTLLRLGLLIVVALAVLPAQGAQVAHAASSTLFLRAVSARSEPKWPDAAAGAPGVLQGAVISQYKYLINADNVGDPSQARNAGCSPSNASYPASCQWPSIRAQTSAAPIVAQGDETTLNTTLGMSLPNGNYLISVMADGYKIDGAHFSIPLPDASPVEVALQPLPLPTATLRAQVFEDNAPVNSAPDLPAEHGLAGFRGVITDSLGEVTTDVYGNPLCTKYETDITGAIILDATGSPTPIAGTGGACTSDANGIVTIPNLGPNRYAFSAIPPDGSDWVQTTTLEGNHDWDTWLQEGATGNDTEFAIAGEPFPFTIAGFVKPRQLPNNPAITGEIKGVIDAVKVYAPLNGGLPYNGGIWGGLSGTAIDKPIENPWIALSDLSNGDQAVYVGQGNANGAFDIKHVPDGSYTLTYWDGPQTYILDLVNVTVKHGEVVDTGVLFLTGWFTKVSGYVFNDANSNGKRDPGEAGISGYAVALKRRSNTLMDRGSVVVTTDSTGYYAMENAYPLTQWLVLEAYSDRYQTTGITYQTDNQATPTTVIGAGVDVNVLPIIGQSGQLDWGVKPYAPGTNGGIVGTVSYDTTRNELDPRFAAVENWQPGIPGLDVNLYQPVPCDDPNTQSCDADGFYQLDVDGSYLKGQLLNTYVTETWARPKDCQARDVNGNPVDQQVLPPATGGYDCLEGPLMGVQFDEEFAAVDGNYGFGDGCFGVGGYDLNTGACADGSDPTALVAGDYLVDVVIPNDSFGTPMYKVTREEDINIFDGNSYVPQVPPPACAGPLHTVDVAGVGADGPNATVNPNFAAGGGSPYEGEQKPLCSTKLVSLNNGRSIAPTFNLFTDVPLPGRYYGYIVDDLNVSTNPQDLLFGEKAGVPNSPIGVYDFSNHLVMTVQSDPNGIFEMLLPSTTTINCPSPSGVCANLYRLVGNDPGIPGRLNPTYNPQFRTIAATFEVLPGDIIPADLAPTQVGVSIQGPGSQFNSAVSCALDLATPQLFAVSSPNLTTSGGSVTIRGAGFGVSQGAGRVSLGGLALPVSLWNDSQIVVQVPNGISAGVYQLQVMANNGQKTINGLTFHVTGAGYSPTVLTVQKPATAINNTTNFTKIQDAIDAAVNIPQALIVVYPGGVPDSSNPAYNPRKAYFENLIISSPIKLQGVGPGGVYPDSSVVDGSIIDGGAFGGDTALAGAWRTKVASLSWDGNQNAYEAQTVYVVAQAAGPRSFTASYKAAIDGFSIQGGDQAGFPNNINVIGGTPTGQPANVQTQGGGIFVNAYVRNMQITNNILQNNGGAYGGAIRIGTPDLPAPDTSSHNENLRIANNRVVANAGTNLAGGIGLFAGADNYEIANNDICGNFSAEYGGGVSQYGLSPNGNIHDNRIYFNRSYDEAGGIMIAGQLPADPNTLSPGSGAVNLYNNLIQANLSNDDGGGVRFLMAGNFPINLYNNMIVNNVATHEGGGIALDDATNVRVFNNTIMKNITTATAATSNGLAAPAGLSTAGNSTLLQATLPIGSPIFSKPVLFNNILHDNRAGAWNGGGVSGIGQPGDPSPINYWDLGVADGSGILDPTSSVLQQGSGSTLIASPTNLITDPLVVQTYDTSVAVFPWRTNPNFVTAALVAVEAPANLLGNYHIQATSPATDSGAALKTSGALTVAAPGFDIDLDGRPSFGGFDIGADEIRGATANLSITKTDSVTAVLAGTAVRYTIVVANAGPDAVNLASVVDNVPAALTGVTWSCASASAGSSCSVASGTGNINTTVSLLNGGSVVFTLNGTLAASTTAATLVNTATVTAPAGTSDPVSSNSTASDTDTVIRAFPATGVLDQFTRTPNCTTARPLGTSWLGLPLLLNSQAGYRIGSVAGNCVVQVRAGANLGPVFWNTPSFGANQEAYLTLTDISTTATEQDLVLKASNLGGSGTVAANTSMIEVVYNRAASTITIETLAPGQGWRIRATFSGVTLANGDRLGARALADGTVLVFKNTALVGLNNVTAGATPWPTALASGGGRIGAWFIGTTNSAAGDAHFDNFGGGTMP